MSRRTEAARSNAPERAELAKPSGALHTGLWIVQALLFVVYTGTGLWKLLTPIPKLATMIAWAGQVSPTFLYTIAVIDLLGGIGILLPSMIRLWPRVAVGAALGGVALQVCAIVFHISRGEAAKTPFNVVFLLMGLFVFWGRGWKARIAARG